MYRVLRSLIALTALLCVFAPAHILAAQTYTPKAIHFQGSPDLNPADLLRVSGLHEGAPLTKAEIEAGLQKLADTGSFTQISYTVNDTALTITLASAAGAQALPVRFTNFIWWQPSELERAVEARVPLYHGQLALTGSLTDQVKSALIAIAHDKGLTITVAADRSADPVTHQESVAFSIEQPAIRFGTLHIDSAHPAFGTSTDDLIGGLRNQDFDSALSSFTITHDGTDIFHNAGFLDAVVDPPVFSAPHAVGANYIVDATATVHRGDLYPITQLQLNGAPPLSESDLRKISDLKTGDPASPMGLLISGQRIERSYDGFGYLTAEAHTSTTVDHVAHNAAYTISITAGPLFHLAGVDISALPLAAQSAFAHDRRLTPGAVADAKVSGALREDCAREHLRGISIESRLDRKTDTVTFVVRPGGAPRAAEQPTSATE